MIIEASLLWLFQQNSYAAEVSGYGVEDLKIAKIARGKNYPGGRDEEDLEVQTQLIKPIRKEDTKKEIIETPNSSDDEF